MMGNIQQLLQLNNGVAIQESSNRFPLDLVWRGQKCCDVSQRLRPTKRIAGQRKVDTLMCGRQGQESGGQRGCHQRNGPQKKRSRDAVELNPVVCCAMIQLATQKKREEKHRQFSSFVV